MAKVREAQYIAKRDMTLGGRKVMKGQIITPAGAPNDYRLYGDNTHWTARWNGSDGLLCDTDGCDARFDCEMNLHRHRTVLHAPERDARERARLQAMKDRAGRELKPGDDIVPGESTIDGRPIVDVKRGPGGPVPYVAISP